MLKIWLFCFSIGIAGIPLSAQNSLTGKSPDQVNRAENAIKTLKNGVLIVSIPSNYNKITNLKKMVATTDGREEVRFKNILQTTIDETQKTARDIVSSMDSVYRFSPVLYMYDTAAPALKKGIITNCFLDKSLNPDPNLSLNGRPYLVFKKNPFEDNWLVTDADLEVLQPPFPFKTPGRGVLIFRLSMKFTARYINTKMNEYYLSLDQ